MASPNVGAGDSLRLHIIETLELFTYHAVFHAEYRWLHVTTLDDAVLLLRAESVEGDLQVQHFMDLIERIGDQYGRPASERARRLMTLLEEVPDVRNALLAGLTAPERVTPSWERLTENARATFDTVVPAGHNSVSAPPAESAATVGMRTRGQTEKEQKKAAAVEKERAMAAASSTVFETPETASIYNAALSGDDPTKVRCPCCEAKGIPQKFQPYQVVKVVDGVQTKVCPFGEGAPLESLSPSQWLFITGMVHREGKKEQPWYARLEKFLNQKVERDPGFKAQIQELRQRRWQDKGKGGGRGGGKHGGRTTSNAPQESPNSRVEIAQARDEGQSAVGLKEAADRRAAQKGGLAGVIPNPKSGVAATRFMPAAP